MKYKDKIHLLGEDYEKKFKIVGIAENGRIVIEDLLDNSFSTVTFEILFYDWLTLEPYSVMLNSTLYAGRMGKELIRDTFLVWCNSSE